jgi:hypothetical protein
MFLKLKFISEEVLNLNLNFSGRALLKRKLRQRYTTVCTQLYPRAMVLENCCSSSASYTVSAQNFSLLKGTARGSFNYTHFNVTMDTVVRGILLMF